VAFLDQLLPQLAEVEDFAVEDNRVAPRLIGHRLVAVGRQVEDSQPAETQAAVVVHEVALRVGPAADNGVRRGLQRGERAATCIGKGEYSGDSTHN
jgi:triphosphoribosyl-dephospho-CoA synthetase